MSKIPSQATCFIDLCGTSNDKVKDVHVTYSPHPPQRDKNVTIYFNGNLTEQVDKGEIELKVFLGTREISDKPYDLCHNLPAVNLSCPLHPGPLRFTFTTHIPKIVLPGKYSAVANFTDQNHNVLFCLKGSCLV
ncbi:uncharacterized protein [Dysidea avara]